MSDVVRTYWYSDGIAKGYPVHDEDAENRWIVDPPATPALRGGAPPEANCVSSLLADGRHAPAIDLDLPCQLVPSSTPGHFHLLIDRPMSWRRYRRLLKALVKAGLVERRYYEHSIRRRQTFLRLPHVKKGLVSGEV